MNKLLVVSVLLAAVGVCHIEYVHPKEYPEERITDFAILSISYDNRFQDQLILGLFRDIAPKSVENFIKICAGETKHKKVLLTYQRSAIFQIVKHKYVRTGDITNNNGTGGLSIYEGEYQPDGRLLKNLAYSVAMVGEPMLS